jgi:DNA repair protein RadC
MCGWYLRMHSKWCDRIDFCHNHPSGTLVPSEADKQITKKTKNSRDSLEIKILDHLIVTETNYYSFVDEGIF